MRSILNLIGHLKTKDRAREYDAFSVLDENVKKLENKIGNIEKKNMRYFCRAELVSLVDILPAGTIIPWDATIYPQFGNMHDNAINNSRIYIRRDGVYYITCTVAIRWTGDPNPGFFHDLYIAVFRNGANIYIDWARIVVTPVEGFHVLLDLATQYYCYINDYIEVSIYNNSGALGVWEITPFSTHGAHVPSLCVSERLEDLDPSEYGLMDPNANMR